MVIRILRLRSVPWKPFPQKPRPQDGFRSTQACAMSVDFCDIREQRQATPLKSAQPILQNRQLSVVSCQSHFSPCRNPKTERHVLPHAPCLPASQFVFSFDVGRWMFDVGRSSSLTALPILRQASSFFTRLPPSDFRLFIRRHYYPPVFYLPIFLAVVTGWRAVLGLINSYY